LVSEIRFLSHQGFKIKHRHTASTTTAASKQIAQVPGAALHPINWG
jgi:hypothetical protein